MQLLTIFMYLGSHFTLLLYPGKSCFYVIIQANEAQRTSELEVDMLSNALGRKNIKLRVEYLYQ